MTPIHLCRVTRKGRRMLSIVCAWPINAPSFSAITPPDERLLRYYCTYTPDHVPPHHPAPSELGLQPLFFVQPCSVATSAAHPTRHFHPLGFQNERKIKRRAQKEEKRSEVEWRKDFQDTSRLLFFPLEISAGFHTVFTCLFTDVSTSCLFAEHSFYTSYSFLHAMPWIFNSMDLLWIKVSLSSHGIEFDISPFLERYSLFSYLYALVTIRSRQ